MSDAIVHCKLGRNIPIPPDICSLVHVDENNEANEDWWKTFQDHLGEQEAVQGQIKGGCHVHGAGEHLRTILHKEVNSLQCSPGTHCRGATSLIGKLKIIEAKFSTIEKDEDPINELKQNTTNCNTAIVLATIWTAELIFYDWD